MKLKQSMFAGFHFFPFVEFSFTIDSISVQKKQLNCSFPTLWKSILTLRHVIKECHHSQHDFFPDTPVGPPDRCYSVFRTGGSVFLLPARAMFLGSRWRKCMVCLLFTVILLMLSLLVMRLVIGSQSYNAYMG